MEYEETDYRETLQSQRKKIYRTIEDIHGFLKDNVDGVGDILELGCGEYPYFEKSVKADIAPIKGYLKIDCNKPFGIKKKFDFVVAIELIEHLWNVDGFLEEIKTVLKPNGSAVISTPNVKYWRVRIDSILAKDTFFDNNGTHLWYFSPESFRKKMEEHGFEIVEMRPLGAANILSLCGGFITKMRVKNPAA